MALVVHVDVPVNLLLLLNSVVQAANVDVIDYREPAINNLFEQGIDAIKIKFIFWKKNSLLYRDEQFQIRFDLLL